MLTLALITLWQTMNKFPLISFFLITFNETKQRVISHELALFTTNTVPHQLCILCIFIHLGDVNTTKQGGQMSCFLFNALFMKFSIGYGLSFFLWQEQQGEKKTLS